MSKYLYGLTFGSEDEKKKFKTDAQFKMEKLGMSVRELADAIGYNRKSVYQFFSDNKIANKFLAAAIANYLEIDVRNF